LPLSAAAAFSVKQYAKHRPSHYFSIFVYASIIAL